MPDRTKPLRSVQEAIQKLARKSHPEFGLFWLGHDSVTTDYERVSGHGPGAGAHRDYSSGHQRVRLDRVWPGARFRTARRTG